MLCFCCVAVVVSFRLCWAIKSMLKTRDEWSTRKISNSTIVPKPGWGRDSQTRTGLVHSLSCITCSFENNAFSVLHYVIKVTFHYLASRIILPWNFRAWLFYAAASQPCSLAITKYSFFLWKLDMNVRAHYKLPAPPCSDGRVGCVF